MQSFIDKEFNYAVIGATQNINKYGYKVLMDFRNKGFQAVPINPKYEEIEGIKCYPSLLDLDDRPDVVIVVTQPEVSLKIVDECANLQLDKIWFQPGAADEEVLQACQKQGINCITEECIMKQTD